jgi:hypothetical protein
LPPPYPPPIDVIEVILEPVIEELEPILSSIPPPPTAIVNSPVPVIDAEPVNKPPAPPPPPLLVEAAPDPPPPPPATIKYSIDEGIAGGTTQEPSKDN